MMRYLLLLLISCAHLSAGLLSDYIPPNFFMLMADQKKFDLERALNDPGYLICDDLYNKALDYEVDLSQAPRIPLKFHLIWLGSPVPERYFQLKRQLEEMHPGAVVKIWTYHEVKKFPLINEIPFLKSKNYGAKSDILRYEILWREGGVYFDGDFELLKPMTELLYAVDFFTGAGGAQSSYGVCNGLIGSVQGHPILKACIDAITDYGPLREDNNVNEVMERTGPNLFSKCLIAHYEEGEYRNLVCPFSFFYPWPFQKDYSLTPKERARYLKPWSYAVHLWARSWQPGTPQYRK